MPVDTVRLLESPTPHCGLGSGTQMACTLIAALAAATARIHQVNTETTLTASIEDLLLPFAVKDARNKKEQIRRTLGRLSNRGARSNIGLTGFLEGGLVVDYGQSEYVQSDSAQSEMARTERLDFPMEWPILIVSEGTSSVDFGSREIEMFAACSKRPNPERETMMSLIRHELVPATIARDWHRFDRSIGEYGRLAGQVFSSVQGGIYRTSRIADIVSFTKSHGVQGAVQSSWGPSVCIVTRDRVQALGCIQKLTNHFPGAIVHSTFAANEPATVEQRKS